jgi:hypothetical protein
MNKIILILVVLMVAGFTYGQAYFTANDVVASGGVTGGILGTISTESTITTAGNDLNAHQCVVITLDEYLMGMNYSPLTPLCKGTVVLYTFPEGYLEITGVHCNLDITNITEDGIAATTEYDVGLGYTRTDGMDGVLDDVTDYDILGIMGGDLADYAATVQSQKTTDVGIDGQTTAAKMWLNCAYLDADVTANTTQTVSGTVTVYYRILGDD